MKKRQNFLSVKNSFAEGIQEVLGILRKTPQMEILFDELCAPSIRTKIWPLAAHGDFCMLILH